MKRSILVRAPVSALLAAMLFVGCADQDRWSGGTPLAPDAPLLSKGGNDVSKEAKAKKAEKAGKATKVKGKKNGRSVAEYTLVRVTSPTEFQGKALIGPEGGKLKVGGHKLEVPKGAVEKLTQFRMKVEKKGDGQDVDLVIQLRATAEDTVVTQDEYGNTVYKITEVDVGAKGFAVPVKLILSYEGATNVDGSDDSLVIGWLRQVDGELQLDLLETMVHPSGKWGSALLHHFSDYALAFP